MNRAFGEMEQSKLPVPELALGYARFFKALKFLGIFPYHFDEEKLQLCTLVGWRQRKSFSINVAIAILIFLKQLYLLQSSLFSQEVKICETTNARPDLMFRTMWFLGSLFLNSMFLLHVLHAKEFVLAVTAWLRHEHRVLGKF